MNNKKELITLDTLINAITFREYELFNIDNGLGNLGLKYDELLAENKSLFTNLPEDISSENFNQIFNQQEEIKKELNESKTKNESLFFDNSSIQTRFNLVFQPETNEKINNTIITNSVEADSIINTWYKKHNKEKYHIYENQTFNKEEFLELLQRDKKQESILLKNCAVNFEYKDHIFQFSAPIVHLRADNSINIINKATQRTKRSNIIKPFFQKLLLNQICPDSKTTFAFAHPENLTFEDVVSKGDIPVKFSTEINLKKSKEKKDSTSIIDANFNIDFVLDKIMSGEELQAVINADPLDPAYKKNIRHLDKLNSQLPVLTNWALKNNLDKMIQRVNEFNHFKMIQDELVAKNEPSVLDSLNYREIPDLIFDKQKLKEWFATNIGSKKRLVFFDFETINSPLTIVPGATKPYDIVVVQNSVKIVEDNKVIFKENYLWDPKELSVEDLEQVVLSCHNCFPKFKNGKPDTSNTAFFMYSPFEKTQLTKIKEMLRNHDFLTNQTRFAYLYKDGGLVDDIINVLIDLNDVFKKTNKIVLDKNMSNNNNGISIKKIQKMILKNPELKTILYDHYNIKDRSQMLVKNGAEATSALESRFLSGLPEDKLKGATIVSDDSRWKLVEEELKYYCDIDVLLMVLIYDYLKYNIDKKCELTDISLETGITPKKTKVRI